MSEVDIFVQFTALGFGVSLIVYLEGQGVRIMGEIIEHFTKR